MGKICLTRFNAFSFTVLVIVATLLCVYSAAKYAVHKKVTNLKEGIYDVVSKAVAFFEKEEDDVAVGSVAAIV